MKSLVNFVLFQLGWFACVGTAAKGSMWFGPLVVLAIVILHLCTVTRRGQRAYEFCYIALVGLFGLWIDSSLQWLGIVEYPTSQSSGPSIFVPPWITALWCLFATLPHHSLRWLSGRTWLAAGLGAIGGPLSFLAGARMGVVETGSSQVLTWGALSLQYAIVTPALLALARTHEQPALSITPDDEIERSRLS